MKVIVGAPVWSLNGVNTFSANLARGLGSAGYDAEILLTGVTYRERKPLTFPRDLKFVQLEIPTFATWPRRWRALIDYLESRAPCVYIPNYDFRHSCVTSALSARVGVVGIVHSDDPRHYDHARRMGSSWNAAVGVSRRITERLEKSHGILRERLSTIPYGVEVATELPPRQASGRFDLVYTGRLEQQQKRVHDLLRIATALTNRKVDYSLAIVGEGPERGALGEGIRQRGLSRSVELLGSVSNAEIPALCAMKDAFLLTSAYEGMPISLLEAMGQGNIAFASSIESGVPELVVDGRNGFIIPVGDIEGFAKCIASVATSAALRSAMRHDAWTTVATGDYGLPSMVGKYRNVIDEVFREAEAGTFVRSGTISPVDLSLDERIAAPLWALRPDLKKQLAPRQ